LAISQRLVELLPKGKDVATPGRAQAGTSEKKFSRSVLVFACLALLAVALYLVL
jgi:hypothetical protein